MTQGSTRDRDAVAHRQDPRHHRGPGEQWSDWDDQVRDVQRARAGVRNAGVSFGPRSRRRTPGERWSDFADRYGWRAYALPMLVVITIAALLTTNTVARNASSGNAPQAATERSAATAPPVADPNMSLKNDDAGGDVNETALKAAALPAGAAYTTKGTGSFRTLAGTSAKVGHGQLYRYSIEVEKGITGVDLHEFETLVVSTLSDSRSWSGHGVTLQRVDSGRVDFRIALTSTLTVRKLCGYSIPVETSCYAPAGGASPVNRVVFNVARWERGATAYVGNVDLYRVYMINHEDGHALGHNHAHQCLPGGLAPAMMQQTFGLRSTKTGKFCQANPWPYPTGSDGKTVAGAPGAEQVDTSGNNEYGHGD